MFQEQMNDEGWLDPQKIPDEATKYILMQRTAYIKFKKSPSFQILKKINPHLTYKFFIWRESKQRKEKIKFLYMNDMKLEFESMVDFLPPQCANILDIGCGLAGIDIYLYHNYGRGTKITLLDRSATDSKIRYNFRDKGAFYNSLHVAKKNLCSFGAKETDITCCEANSENSIEADGPFDLIISLLSWGFHYPVDVYLPAVQEKMANNAKIILDVRKKTNGMNMLQSAFSKVEVIYEREKYVRVCCMNEGSI